MQFRIKLSAALVIIASATLQSPQVYAEDVTVHVLAGDEKIPDSYGPYEVFYAGQHRVKYFVKTSNFGHVRHVGLQTVGNRGNLSFQQVHIENGAVVLEVQAAENKPALVDLVISADQ